MNLFNFIFSEEDLIFSEEWQFYYILDILYPNTPNKILGENNEINNFSSIRNFKFSFKFCKTKATNCESKSRIFKSITSKNNSI